MKRRKPDPNKRDGESGDRKYRKKKALLLSSKVQKGSVEYKLSRQSYLQQLIREFQDDSSSQQAKEQVLANLANFGYDPYHFEFFKEIGIIQLFLGQLEQSNNSKIIEFALGGLCNCAPDPLLGRLIINHGGVQLIKQCLSSISTQHVISAATILRFLLPYDDTKSILTPDIKPQLEELTQREDNRIQNIAFILLNEFNERY